MGEEHTCMSGPACKTPAGTEAYPSTDPLCGYCLDAASRDIQALVYDYLDLAQLHAPAMSQAINEKTAGSKEKQMLLQGHVEALQAEIVHVLITWEYEIRVAARLSDPYVSAPVADWHTTITRPTPLAKVRPGAAVQRAVSILAPRMRLLSRRPATLVCPTGVEDDHAEVAGWEAVLHLVGLHSRSRSLLGRTRRVTVMPGECSSCRGELFRAEPRDQDDPCDVYCGTCHTTWAYDDYTVYVGQIVAMPGRQEAA